jgi:riboflavin synthase
MFTGIIEAIGTVATVHSQGNNKTFWIQSPLSDSFKVDQSVSHDGVCLTVEEIAEGRHRVTAIEETLSKTNLAGWVPGESINLEQSLIFNGRIDGHLVQGHVDTTASCTRISPKDGSWQFRFEFPASFSTLVIEKGSIAVNGISLTAFNVTEKEFEIGIIPYTYHHTNIRHLKAGMVVNLEFDLLGKYINRMIDLKK